MASTYNGTRCEYRAVMDTATRDMLNDLSEAMFGRRSRFANATVNALIRSAHRREFGLASRSTP